jgi:hypothetical protein
LKGYVYSDTLNGVPFEHYARVVRVDANGNVAKGKKGTEVTLRAVKLPLDDSGENFVYYACNPEDNGKHMFIGFIGKDNPAPCCFIKDQFESKNPKKRDLYMRSIGLMGEAYEHRGTVADQMYILQDNILVNETRFAFLPKYLDILMNAMLNKTIDIENHNLLAAMDGYYFKYGVKPADSNRNCF